MDVLLIYQIDLPIYQTTARAPFTYVFQIKTTMVLNNRQ